MERRLFLSTYKDSTNYHESVLFGVFGARDSGAGGAKFEKLQRGDLIVLRDASIKDQLKLLGCGVVVGDVFHQDHEGPYRMHLWQDEVDQAKVIYQMRVAADFKRAPQPRRDAVSWSDLDILQLRGADNQLLVGQQAWGKRFSGNMIADPHSVSKLCKLFQISTEA